MTNYPSNLDTDAELPSVSDNITEIGGEAINAVRGAIFALEKAIGIDPQGSALSLSNRLDATLNPDGTFKASALTAAGLIALPIVDSQVGTTAGILESKLNLDISTASLQTQVTSNDLDIVTLRNALNALLNNFTLHTVGSFGRHDGYQVDMLATLAGADVSVSTVEASLNLIWNTFLDHRAGTTITEHFASAISYTPDTNQGVDLVVTADNVQDAISQIDVQFLEDRRIHNDSAHSDGVSSDGYFNFGGQANVNDASGRLTRYQTPSPDIMQIGLINASSIKSKNFAATSISLTASAIDIRAYNGTSSRLLSVVNIDAADFPSGSGRLSLRAVVDYLNQQFATNEFPVSAYESRDGELVLQHNIARDDCYISISAPGANSAVLAMGLTAVAGQGILRVNNFKLVINGNQYSELKTISSGSITQAGASTIIDLGVDVTASGLNLFANSLIHIYNHSTGSANGTYRVSIISPASPSPTTSIALSVPMAAGTFDYIIYGDSFNTNFAGNFRTVDFYLESDRTPAVSQRMDITSVQISGLRVVEVSQGWPAATGALVVLTKSGTTYSLSTIIGTDSSIVTTFEEGFLGYVKVFAPDNKAFVTMLVSDAAPPSPRTDTVDFTATEFQDDRLLLGTTFSDASSILEIPVDVRNVGLTGVDALGSEVSEGILGRDLANLHMSGIVRGFDVLQINSGNNSVEINGGFAYIDGIAICKERQDVDITIFATTTGTWNLFLTRNGNYEVFEEGTAGKSISDALLQDNFIPITQITITAGPAVSTTTDARLFINDVESRLQLTVDDRDLGAGSFRSLEAAVLHSKSAPNDTKPEIIVLSNLTITGALTIDADARIICFNDLTLNSTLTISAGATLEVFGILTVTGTTTLSSNSKLACHGTSVFSSGITLSSGTDLELKSDASLVSITIAGSDINVVGLEDKPTITFDGTTTGIITSGSVSSLFIRDLELRMTNALFPIIDFAFIASDIQIARCELKQATTLPLANIVQTARAGLVYSAAVSDLTIRDCLFSNLGVGISGSDVLTNAYIHNNRFFENGYGIRLFDGYGVSVDDNRFDEMHLYAVDMSNFSLFNIMINSNVFLNKFDPTSNPICISGQATPQDLIIHGNIFHNLDTTSIILLSGEGIVISDNVIHDCITSSFAIDMSSITGLTVISDNVIKDHSGQLLKGPELTVVGNQMETTSSTGGNTIEIGAAASGTIEALFVNNRVNIVTTNEVVTFYDCNISNNQILAGSGVISSTRASIVGNYMVFDDTTVTNSLTLTAASFSDNYIQGSPTAAVVLADSASGHNVCQNVVVGNAGTILIDYNSAIGGVISNNTLNALNHVYGIFVGGNNAVVIGNNISGTITGGGGGAIVGETSATDMLIANNFCSTAGGDTRVVFHQSSAPTDVVIKSNKGAEERQAFSVYNGFQSTGDWSVPNTATGISSSTLNAHMYVVLDGLTVGTLLESVTVHVNNAGGLGDAVIQVYRRDTTSLTPTDVTDPIGEFDVPSGVFSALVVPVRTAEQPVLTGSSFFVEINIRNTNLVTFGQVTANIRY